MRMRNDAVNIEIQRISGVLAGICATFMGTVIGAGFASGREIYQFFSRYGLIGFGGIGVAFILMGWASFKVYQAAYYLKPRSYQELLIFLLGPLWAGWADCLMSLFYLILIAVMFAGSGVIFETIQVGYWYGIAITAALVIAALWQELNGIIAVNLVVIPLMFAGSLLVSGHSVRHGTTSHLSGSNGGFWLLAALQFCAYNLVLAIPVLLSLGKRYPFPRILKLGGWLGCLGLGLMTAFINWALLCQGNPIQDCPLPMVELARPLGLWAYFGYVAILWGEMVTTLLANTYGLAIRLVALTGWPYRFWVITLIPAGVLLAQIGFTDLIAKAYPFYGILCFFLLVLLFIRKPSRTALAGNAGNRKCRRLPGNADF